MLGFTFVYMFYTFKLPPQLKIGRYLSLLRDYVSGLFPAYITKVFGPVFQN